MNQFNTQVQSAPAMDLGLRSFMLGTYRWMALAMLVTGAVAYGFGQYLLTNPGLAQAMFGNLMVPLLFVGVIIFGFSAIGKRLPTMSMGGVLIALFAFAALLGVFAAPIGLIYSPGIIAKVFFMAVAMFGGLSLFGYTTSFNLGAIVKYALAVFIAFVVVQFAGFAFESLRFAGTGEVIFLLIGLGAIAVITAFQTQNLKQTYYSVAGHGAMEAKLSAFGAASLLLSFYNMFTILLQLFGRD